MLGYIERAIEGYLESKDNYLWSFYILFIELVHIVPLDNIEIQ